MTDFPLTPPASFKAARFSMSLDLATVSQRSPFTLTSQKTVYMGSIWMGNLEVARRRRASGGAEIEAFVTALRGEEGSFIWSPPQAMEPRGALPEGGLSVSSGGQTGRQLVMNAATPWTLKAGDMFSIGTGLDARIYRVVLDVESGVGNAASVRFEPALKASPANGAAVTVRGAVGCWELTAAPSVTIEPPDLISVSLSLIEAI